MIMALHEPLDYLIVGVAYSTMVDKSASASERAKLLSLMQKHVDRGDVSATWLKEVVPAAMDYVKQVPFPDFLIQAGRALSPAQKLSLAMNMADVIMVDGKLNVHEHAMLRRIPEAVGIDTMTWYVVLDILRLTHDTTVFVDPNHPFNGPEFFLRLERK